MKQINGVLINELIQISYETGKYKLKYSNFPAVKNFPVFHILN